ncbi:MAG: metal-dependent hydrolase [Saprospiraceae bacterium]|nr:metal-dependent hydrolase [Saprospiraceae bacterium]
MKITYYGHSTLLIELNGKNILVDPFISGNPLASEVDIDAIKCDYIFITHGHQDHVLDVERIASNNPDALLVSNYEIVSWFQEKGIKGHPLNHGGKYNFDFGTAKYVNAVHSSVLPDGSYGGNPGGFVLWHENECIYIAGDTALTRDMELIPMTCPKVKVAVLPIGDNFTMGYKDASIASDFIKCNSVIGCHYDSFPPITIDKSVAVAHFISRGKDLTLLEVGESKEV